MRDLAVERRYPLFLFDVRESVRCPSCFAIPTTLYRSVVYGDRPGRVAYVDTCTSHYCRSRAREFARFR